MLYWLRLLRSHREHLQWERHRLNAEYRASCGEHLPLQERVEYNLPDWTR